ncbi:MAG: SpoIID/LytB domain-containing protein [Nitrospirota bacterium]
MRILLSSVFFLLSVFGLNAYASETVRVLIVNDAYSTIPDKNEKMERLGRMQGDLLVSGTRYTGNIDVWKGESGIHIINEIPLEEYIKDVVAVEVSPDWDMEALKAQAVVSRTYALYQKRMNGGALYHLASSTLHQVYKGNNPDVRVSYAVEETRGEILTYDDSPIEAFYHSTCGGKTEDSEEVFGRGHPYLRPVESPCTLSPYSSWEREIPFREIEKALNVQGIKDVWIRSRTATGRVRHLAVTHGGGVMSVSATDFRKAVGWTRLPSTNFTIQKQDDTVVFSGKGYGHGIGLCQWCALEMARDGKNYKEILSHFYPGAVIQLHESR